MRAGEPRHTRRKVCCALQPSPAGRASLRWPQSPPPRRRASPCAVALASEAQPAFTLLHGSGNQARTTAKAEVPGSCKSSATAEAAAEAAPLAQKDHAKAALQRHHCSTGASELRQRTASAQHTQELGSPRTEMSVASGTLQGPAGSPCTDLTPPKALLPSCRHAVEHRRERHVMHAGQRLYMCTEEALAQVHCHTHEQRQLADGEGKGSTHHCYQP